MDEIELTGDYYEVGRQYGRHLAAGGFSPPPASAEKREFARTCRPHVEEHAPELLAEIEGIADAGGWEQELVEAVPLALTVESGCSVVAVSGDRTESGASLFGRNYDFYRSFARFSELYRTGPAGRYASVGCSDHWTGRHDGVNEAGLAVGHTYVPNRGEQPGVTFALAARALLDSCGTVADSVAFLERVPHARNTNFLLADATGEIAVVEASPEAVTTTSRDGFGAATNHFLSDPMCEYEPTDADRADSEARLGNLGRWEAETASVTVDALQGVMADPADGVCARASGDAEPVETLWSWTAVLDEPRTYLARGRPDEQPYEPVALPA